MKDIRIHLEMTGHFTIDFINVSANSLIYIYPLLPYLPLHKGTNVLLPISKVDASKPNKYARFPVPFPEWFRNDHMEHNINQSSAIEPSQIHINTTQTIVRIIIVTIVQQIPFFNRTFTEWSIGRILGVMCQLVSTFIFSLFLLSFLVFTRGLTFKWLLICTFLLWEKYDHEH